MLKIFKKIWQDPVGSNLIAYGFTAAGGLSLIAYFWTEVVTIFLGTPTYLLNKSELPNWLLGILFLIPLLLITLIVVVIWNHIRTPRIDWHAYTEDTFFGIRWRWGYNDNHMSKLFSFCPNCDFQIFPMNISSFAALERTGFHCDCCNSTLNEFNESYQNLESKVTRLIQQNIRTGRWKEAMNNDH